MVPVDVERNIKIPGSELQIYGTYREVPGAPLVIFSHCLAGERNSLEYFNGARAMSDAGFSSYRFDYYGYDVDARNLVDCIVPEHVADFDLVVKTFKEEDPDRSVTVIGHSLGGLVILMSERQQFDAAVL